MQNQNKQTANLTRYFKHLKKMQEKRFHQTLNLFMKEITSQALREFD